MRARERVPDGTQAEAKGVEYSAERKSSLEWVRSGEARFGEARCGRKLPVPQAWFGCRRVQPGCRMARPGCRKVGFPALETAIHSA